MSLDLLTREPTTDDVPVEVKRALIREDMQMWRNTRFQAESRRRTYARIGKSDAEAAQMKMLTDCEAALMDLEEQLKAQ